FQRKVQVVLFRPGVAGIAAHHDLRSARVALLERLSRRGRKLRMQNVKNGFLQVARIERVPLSDYEWSNAEIELGGSNLVARQRKVEGDVFVSLIRMPRGAQPGHRRAKIGMGVVFFTNGILPLAEPSRDHGRADIVDQVALTADLFGVLL